MRALVDLKSHVLGSPQIVQVERTPVTGAAGAVGINGRFALPLFQECQIDNNMHVLPVDGSDVTSISMSHLLAAYPLFGNVFFNPLLTADNVAELDLTTQFKDVFTDPATVYMYSPRLQTGKPSPDAQQGQMPTHTALLPINPTTDPVHPNSLPNHPGLLMTKEIDLSAYTIDPVTGNPVGADEFMLYWKLYEFDATHDVATGTTNDPAIRSVLESDQEPVGFSAYLSPDNGATWCRAGLQESVAFCNKTKRIRVAFLNTSSKKVYIAVFGVLF